MQVNFYILDEDLNCPKENIKLLFACHLLEKAYNLGHSIFVYCASLEEAHIFDELLWTYKDNSFIPHNIQGEGPEPPPAIQIGYTDEPRGFNDIILNLTDCIPLFYKKFKKIIEIVDSKNKESARVRFRKYKQQKLELKTHTIDRKAFLD